MKADNRVIDLTPDVKWIGVLDYDIRTFDIVMHTDHGTTYNSYFINAEKKAIIETAKEKFSDVFLSKLRQATDPAELAYIVLDHTEPIELRAGVGADCGGFGVDALRDHLRGHRRVGAGNHLHLAVEAAQVPAALADRLLVRVDLRNLGELCAGLCQ
ncbi:MAG TPA: hypothetical protein PKE28_08190 [Bacteroidales bacterium]|nr:hypothetical protein [Bacteroidales bacterium]